MIYRPFLNKSNAVWLRIFVIAAFIIGTAVSSSVTVAAPQKDAAVRTLPEEISVVQAKDKKAEGVFFLDVRNPDEYYPAHISGSILIPLPELEKRLKELPQDKEIVVVCRSGGRSSVGRDILKKAGFTQVTSVTGGMNAWNAAGYPTVSGRK